MKVLIITHGDIKDPDYYRDIVSDMEYVICVDGAIKYAYEMGIIPNVIVGDFDSVELEQLNFYNNYDTEILEFPCEKDETDTEIAVKEAIKKGATEITIIGAIGSRMDHTIANISLLYLMLTKGVKGRIINENNEIYLVRDSIKIMGRAGDIVSLLPFTLEVSGIYTTGLKYPLVDGTMKMGIPYGVSNVMVANEAEIKIKNGLLLVIRSKD